MSTSLINQTMDNLPIMLILLIIIYLSGSQADIFTDNKSKCEEITIPMCKGIGYNMTSMPNQFHHEKQDEAGLEVHQFWPLVEIKCSEDLKFFLCSVYTPICMEDYHESIPACRSVCERAKAGCAPVMKQYGFPWPEPMDCKKFPIHGKDVICMDEKAGTAPAPVENSSPPLLTSTLNPPFFPPPNIQHSTQSPHDNEITPRPSIPHLTPQCQCSCRPPLIRLSEKVHHRYYNIIETGGVLNCGQPCLGTYFSHHEQTWAAKVINFFAVCCLVCSAVVVITHWVDTDRFCYPELAIIHVSRMYILVSAGFLFRFYLGHEKIACDGSLVRYSNEGQGSGPCIINFLLIYFAGLSASIWWVVLTLSWVLTASFYLVPEVLSRRSCYFHALTWFLPGVISFIILAMGAIDGEPLAGICSVGNSNDNHLLIFVIIPSIVCLILGFIFLLIGFISSYRVRNNFDDLRQQIHSRLNKAGLDKLLARVVFFAFLYTIPAMTVIFCNIYIYLNRSTWERNFVCPCSPSTVDTPYVMVHLIKYCMNLSVGIATCSWIISRKTLSSWKNFVLWICCCRSRGSADVVGNGSSRSGTSQLIGGSQLIEGSQYLANSQRAYRPINYVSKS